MADDTPRPPRHRRKIPHTTRVRLAMQGYGIPDDGEPHPIRCHYCDTFGTVTVWPKGTYVTHRYPTRKYAPHRRVTSTLTIDHVHPVIKGGDGDIRNLVFACDACNGSKCGRTPDEWTKWLNSPRGLKSPYWERVGEGRH